MYSCCINRSGYTRTVPDRNRQDAGLFAAAAAEYSIRTKKPSGLNTGSYPGTGYADTQRSRKVRRIAWHSCTGIDWRGCDQETIGTLEESSSISGGYPGTDSGGAGSEKTEAAYSQDHRC
ncbi:hypothetical protein D3C78_931340 [compost metagenome]